MLVNDPVPVPVLKIVVFIFLVFIELCPDVQRPSRELGKGLSDCPERFFAAPELIVEHPAYHSIFFHHIHAIIIYFVVEN